MQRIVVTRTICVLIAHWKCALILHPNLFKLLDQYWGPHHVDSFASLMTTQLPVYNSWFRDPMLAGADALAQKDWTCEQYRKCTILSSTSCSGSNKGPEGHNYSDHPMMGRTNLVSDNEITAHRQPHTSSALNSAKVEILTFQMKTILERYPKFCHA